MKRTALLASAVFAITAPALADPGHGMTGSLVHLLTEPDHLAIIAVLAAVGWYSFRRLRRRA